MEVLLQHVLEHIDQRATRLASAPMFEYLRDESLDPVKRLGFAPAVAHFIMSYADMCQFFLQDPAPGDRYGQLANINLVEESEHWRWFVEDLTALGLDPTLSFSNALKFLWGDSTRKTRLLTYEMCKLSATLTSLEKLVLILVIEAAGKVALEVSTPVGQQAALRLGRKLSYFGGQHLESEEHHTLQASTVRETLANVQLDTETRVRALALVDYLYALFDGQLEDAVRFARGNTSGWPTIPA